MTVFYTIQDYNQNNYHLKKAIHNDEGKIIYPYESRLIFTFNEEVESIEEIRKLYQNEINEIIHKNVWTRSNGSFFDCLELGKVSNSVLEFIISLEQRQFTISFHSQTEEELNNLVLKFETIIAQSGITEIKDDEVIRVSVWYLTQHGPQCRSKYIKCPTYEEVSQNYPIGVREKVQNLIQLENPIDIGKLIFWMGDPGTGKTYSVRALLREWKKKFAVHIISDPENFFENVGYVNEVITQASEGKGNLFVIEDSPRAVLSEARGSGDTYSMGRLLNLTDGILGQGLEILFLMTTNDNIKDIDKAFLRDGRCLQRLKFEFFNQKEAQKWLDDQGIETDLTREKYALSELYAIKKNQGADVDSLNSEGIGFTC